jgi:hypothetical protein
VGVPAEVLRVHAQLHAVEDDVQRAEDHRARVTVGAAERDAHGGGQAAARERTEEAVRERVGGWLVGNKCVYRSERGSERRSFVVSKNRSR